MVKARQTPPAREKDFNSCVEKIVEKGLANRKSLEK
jgi:hypothetical protein